MKSIIKRILPLLLAVVLCGLLPFLAQAQAADTVEVQLSAYIKLNGNEQNTEVWQVKLKSLDDGKEQLASVTGSGEIRFDTLSFDKVGDYYYTVEQIAGSNTNCTYDRSVYRVHIQITYTADGRLNKTVAVRKDGEAAKVEQILFVNTFAAIEVETTTSAGETTTLPPETTTAEITVTESTVTDEVPTQAPAQSTIHSTTPYTGDDSGVLQWSILFGFGFVVTILAAMVLCTAKKQEEE